MELMQASSTPLSLGATNRLVDRMAEKHVRVLESKGIVGKQLLLRGVRKDFTRIRHALLEVSSRSPESLLRSFFADEPGIRRLVGDAVQDKHINHLGFEVHEPLDLIIYGFQHWIERGRELEGMDVQLISSHRFTASRELQQRVNAYSEILRLSLSVEGQELMLELFDIHRPMPLMECDRCKHSSVCSAREAEEPTFSSLRLKREEHTQGPWCQLIDRVMGDSLRPVFRHDPIWHYALQVQSEAQVQSLHELFRGLCMRNAEYSMPYAGVVSNHQDRSLHTKLVNRRIHLELEVVMQKPVVSPKWPEKESAPLPAMSINSFVQLGV